MKIGDILMYKLVETVEEQKLFDEIYKSSFKEQNYELDEYYTGIPMNYLVTNKNGEFSGTIQFVEFDPNSNKSILDFSNLFLEHDLLANYPKQKFWEVDKLSVLSSQRKEGTLDCIVEAINEITFKHHVDYLLGEINPIFHRALKINYGFDVINVSDIMDSKNKKYQIIPIIISLNCLRESHLETNFGTTKKIGVLI